MADTIDKAPEFPSVEPFAEYGELITTHEMASLTGQCAESIRSHIKRGQLPGVKIGQRYYVVKSVLISQIRGSYGEA